MAGAADYDFFGEGVNAQPLAPDDPDDQPNPANPGGISNNEYRKRMRALHPGQAITPGDPSGLDVNGNPYSTLAPGTRTGRTTKDGSGNTVYIVADPSREYRDQYNDQLGQVVPEQGDASDVWASGKDLNFIPNPKAGQSFERAPIVDSAFSSALSNHRQGDALADQVLATEPTVAPGNQVTPGNRDALTPVIDPRLQRNEETDRALAQSQDLIDRILNQPLQTKLLGDQALSSQLAVARSARGGAGAVQDATNTALGMQPQLNQQAAQASIQEQVARAGAAGQAASIYAGVASGNADRAVHIAEANQRAGLSVLNNLTQLTGFDYQFDEAKMAQIGALAGQYFENERAYANLGTQAQIAEWNNMTQKYGIDKNFDAAIRKISADENIGPLDALKMVLGIGTAVGGLAL